MVEITDGDDGLELTVMSIQRKVFIMLMLFTRLVISGVVLVFGLVYFSNTFRLEDIILNVLALELVLNAHVLIFQGLAPFQLKNFMGSLHPITTVHWAEVTLCGRKVSGIDVHAQLRFITMALLLIFFFFSQVVPNIQGLNNARDILCSGRLDFAYADTLSPPYFAYSHTKLLPDSMVTSPGIKLKEYEPQTWRETAMKSIILDEVADDSDVATTHVKMLGYTKGSLKDLVAHDVQWASGKINPKCEDVGSTALRPWELNNIMDKLGNRSIGQPCKADGPWQDACYKDTFFGQLARLYCSELCGCGQPSMPQVKADKGCPTPCNNRAQAILRYRRCKDMTAYHLRTRFPEDFQNCANRPCRLTSYWTELTNNFVVATDTRRKQMALTISSRLRTEGCAAVSSLSQEGTDLCSQVSVFPGYEVFRMYCPQACQCSQDRTRYCPDACAATGTTR